MTKINPDQHESQWSRFIYLPSFYTLYIQVISRPVVLWAEETSTYSWSRFCTVNCRLPTFPHKVWGLNCRTQGREAIMLPLPHCCPLGGLETYNEASFDINIIE